MIKCCDDFSFCAKPPLLSYKMNELINRRNVCTFSFNNDKIMILTDDGEFIEFNVLNSSNDMNTAKNNKII